MTFTDINEMAVFISRHHATFNGYSIWPSKTVRAFDTLMRTLDFLKANREDGVVGVNFNAEMKYYDESGVYCEKDTVITVELDGEGLRYTEQFRDRFEAKPETVNAGDHPLTFEAPIR